MIYAHREEFSQHERALAALKSLARGTASWGLPIFVLGEFLRIVTHPTILDPPSPEPTAVAALDGLLESANVYLLIPGDRYWRVFSQLLIDARVRGNIVHDAQIAAVCLEQGATTILTEDRDFRRFPDLTIRSLGAGS